MSRLCLFKKIHCRINVAQPNNLFEGTHFALLKNDAPTQMHEKMQKKNTLNYKIIPPTVCDNRNMNVSNLCACDGGAFGNALKEH